MMHVSLQMTEFQHVSAEDITIGLTLLSLRYEGLRMSDFEAKHSGDAPWISGCAAWGVGEVDTLCW